MKRTLIAVLVAGGLLAGCGGSVTSGTVTGKEHDPAHTSCKTTGTGKNKKKKCKTEAEEWELDLRDANGNTGEVKVDEETWNRIKVGDHYPG